MRDRLRRLASIVGGLVLAGVLAVVGLAPDEAGICAHMLTLARAAGPAEDPVAAGVDETACQTAMERRRAKMGIVRRTAYGICVVTADTLEAVGRC